MNGRLRSFNKTTGAADGVLNASMDTFFNSVMTPPVANNFTSDPRIRYDRATDRWYVIIIDVPGQNGALANRILIGVSNTGTITSTANFTFYFIQVSGIFLDYPTLGVDTNALYIGGNMFSLAGSFTRTDGYVVRKSSILSGGPIVSTLFSGLVATSGSAGPLTPQGVDNFDTAATEGYFVGVDNATFSTMMFRRVSNPGGAPTISGNISLTVPTTTSPRPIDHLGNTGGTNGRLDSIDDRLFAAVIRNGHLWTAHNFRVSTAGVANTAASSRVAVRWYDFTNLGTTPTIFQSGTVFDNAATNPVQYFIPSIMVSGLGHAELGFSSAGTANRANAATTGRLVGDTLGTTQSTPVIYTSSATAYNPPSDPGGGGGRRWGDYSYTSLDPCDDMTMWTLQEFNDASNSYGVRAVKLLAPPPATPTLAAPATLAQGASNVSVSLTGTSASGSGFYDPPAGIACRVPIAASVSGTGVTVNSVTFNSATSLTLNLSVAAGAALGARSVTVTNPDGQIATGVALITIVSGCPAITVNPATLPGGTAGTGYSQTITATGGTTTARRPRPSSAHRLRAPSSRTARQR